MKVMIGEVFGFIKVQRETLNPPCQKRILNFCMPVVFDNTDRVTGYGQKFYEQTLSDLGTGQF